LRIAAGRAVNRDVETGPAPGYGSRMPRSRPDPAAFIALDAGTTRTRGWLVDGERIACRREVSVGARDTARTGAADALRAAVHGLVAGLLEDAHGGAPPQHIAAAGMITSPEGLVEVRHVLAPAGVGELAAAVQETRLPDVSDLPFVFIPGVRTTALPGASGIGATDVLRGEETLCLGLLRSGALVPGGTLLNVGSHWKLIRIDDEGRIAWSVTSLGGEMGHALSKETILASAVPAGPLVTLDPARLQEGMAEARRSGLPRALFCVRLLQLADAAGPEGRMSFLIGALVAADLDGWRAQGRLTPGTRVTISGDEKVGGAWSVALAELSHPVRRLSAAEVETALVAGLRAILDTRANRD
jgi:2-dehydro-3-deoxygalactonokinase